MAASSPIRDLVLEVEMSPKLTLRVPVFIRYDLYEQDGDLRITRLAAYWELPGMIRQFVRCGVAAAPVGAKLTMALLRNQGVRGTLGFAEGFRRVGAAAKSAVERFLEAAAGDVQRARGLLGPDAPVTAALMVGDRKGVGFFVFGVKWGPISAVEMVFGE